MRRPIRWRNMRVLTRPGWFAKGLGSTPRRPPPLLPSLVLRSKQPASRRVFAGIPHHPSEGGKVRRARGTDEHMRFGLQVPYPVRPLPAARQQIEPASLHAEPDLDRVGSPALPAGGGQVAVALGRPVLEVRHIHSRPNNDPVEDRIPSWASAGQGLAHFAPHTHNGVEAPPWDRQSRGLLRSRDHSNR